MVYQSAAIMAEAVKAHATAADADAARLRALSPHERGVLIESACEAAAIIYRSRLAAGLAPAEPDPWPLSTWQFLREHAARVRS